MRGRSGLSIILTATIVAGIAGYLITWLVPLIAGAESYAVFAVFWSFLYLLVGMFSGVQQEITRATIPVPAGGRQAHPGKARNLGVSIGIGVIVVALGSSPLWADRVFPGHGIALVLPLAAAVASYVLVATLSGTLYGIGKWGGIGALTMLDAVLRLIAIGIGLIFTHDVVALAWLAALPFGFSLAIVWAVIRRTVVGRSDVDSGYRSLLWNSGRTVVAAAAMGILISGFPLILSITSPGVQPVAYSTMVLAITMSRAPLIVSIQALQSLLLVRFKQQGGAGRRFFWLVLGGIAGGGVVIAGLGYLLGPFAFDLLYAAKYDVPGPLVAALVLSSAVVAALSVTGSAVLARDLHFGYALGWVLAALTTIGLLLVPAPFGTRTLLALLLPPFVGLAAHGIVLLRDRRTPSSPHTPGNPKEEHLEHGNS